MLALVTTSWPTVVTYVLDSVDFTSVWVPAFGMRSNRPKGWQPTLEHAALHRIRHRSRNTQLWAGWLLWVVPATLLLSNRPVCIKWWLCLCWKMKRESLAQPSKSQRTSHDRFLLWFSSFPLFRPALRILSPLCLRFLIRSSQGAHLSSFLPPSF